MSPRASNKVPCPLCGTSFVGRYALEVHLTKHHKPCPFCPRSFIRVAMHIRLAHPTEYTAWVNES